MCKQLLVDTGKAQHACQPSVQSGMPTQSTVISTTRHVSSVCLVTEWAASSTAPSHHRIAQSHTLTLLTHRGTDTQAGVSQEPLWVLAGVRG